MKKWIGALFIAVFIAVAPFASMAHGGHVSSVDEVLVNILSNQNTEKLSNLKCENVPDDEWEQLGDAVMSLMHPDSKTHEVMDNMMGGEGSNTLRAAHIQMGMQYLGCGSGGVMPFGMIGMLNGNMMGFGVDNTLTGQGMFSDENVGSHAGLGMMGYPYSGFGWGGMMLGWIFMIIFWALVIAGIVWLVKLFSGKSGGNKAINDLKERYAKGEITKEEFNNMKKDIQ